LPYRTFDQYKNVEIQGCDGSIEFRGVNFVYPLEDINAGTLLFTDMSINIAGKTKVGLVGKSGSGKSTVLKLINRLYDPISGTIAINGQDIKKVGRSYLSKLVSFIPQEANLFDRPVFENIGYGYPPIREYLLSGKNLKFIDLPEDFKDIIINAAKKAICHDFILDSPKGYDSVCGGDSSFSGGQKQRISIARSLSNIDAQILLLDEATSALDASNSSLIQQLTEELNITIVSVVHNFNLVQNFDQIFLFDSGSIVASGTHTNLLESNDLYRQLWESQTPGGMQ
jgi:ABC-type multidrug transport system fused ATPase/permease subunit